jgi:inhibitor of KinA sporulation pathway (predicted exonuclease)
MASPFTFESEAGKEEEEEEDCNENHDLPRQDLDYLLVLDFEATCERDKLIKPQEIIEFPVVALNLKTLQVDAIFQSYVKPVAHPKLSKFCTELTGITQEQVSGKDVPVFKDVLEKFKKWLTNHKLMNTQFAFVACGDWDFGSMINQQCQLSQVEKPKYFNRWINIKTEFCKCYKVKRAGGMVAMLKQLNIELQGRHHCGLDDAKNTASIAKQMTLDGFQWKVHVRSNKPSRRFH